MTVIKQQAKGRTYWYSRHVVDGKRTQVRIPDLDPETGRKISTEKQRTSYDGKIAQQYAKGDLTARSNSTFGELCIRWEELMLPQVPKLSTVKSYNEDLKRIRGTADAPGMLCHIKLKQFGAEHVIAWLNTMIHLKYNTRRNALTLLRSILNMGIEWNWLSKNPAKSRSVKLGAPDKTRLNALSLAQIPHFIQSSKTATEQRRYKVAINTGLRMGEMLAMRRSLFDSEEGTYRVCDRMGNYDYKNFCLSAPKSKASAQTVALMPAVVDALKAQIAHVNEVALATRNWPITLKVRVAEKFSKTITEETIDNDLIWPIEATYRYSFGATQVFGQAGTLDSYDKWYKAFKATAARTGLPAEHTYHDLRHTCASIMIDNNENIKTVQRQMRHEKASITLNTYAHLFPQVTTKAMDRLQKSLGW
mgnify:FL=1